VAPRTRLSLVRKPAGWPGFVALALCVGLAGHPPAPGTGATSRPVGLQASAGSPQGPASFPLPANGWTVEGLHVSGARVVAVGSALQGSTCRSAVVDPATGHLGPATPVPCLAPSFLGGPVAATPIPGTLSVAVRAWWPTAEGRVRYGPVIMTLSTWGWSHSGGAVESDGSIWAYDDEAKPMSILQISAATGRVEERVPLPGLSYDPVLAADDDGLWAAPGPDFSSYSSGAPLYLLRPGSKVAVVTHWGGISYEWMVASGQTVLADILSQDMAQTVWRFDGPSARPRFSVPGRLLPGPLGIGNGYAAVGNATAGLATLDFVGPDTYTAKHLPGQPTGRLHRPAQWSSIDHCHPA